MGVPRGVLSPFIFMPSCQYILDTAKQIWYTQKIIVAYHQEKILAKSISTQVELDASEMGRHQ